MRMRLKTLYFAANRPTIGALIGLGGDFGAAFSSGKPMVSVLSFMHFLLPQTPCWIHLNRKGTCKVQQFF